MRTACMTTANLAITQSHRIGRRFATIVAILACSMVTNGSVPTTDAAEPDRSLAAATLILQRGGYFDCFIDGKRIAVRDAAHLPMKPYQINDVRLDRSTVKDNDFAIIA